MSSSLKFKTHEFCVLENRPKYDLCAFLQEKWKKIDLLLTRRSLVGGKFLYMCLCACTRETQNLFVCRPRQSEHRLIEWNECCMWKHVSKTFQWLLHIDFLSILSSLIRNWYLIRIRVPRNNEVWPNKETISYFSILRAIGACIKSPIIDLIWKCKVISKYGNEGLSLSVQRHSVYLNDAFQSLQYPNGFRSDFVWL